MNESDREALARYVAELFAPEDEVLRDLAAEIAAGDMPEIQISPEEGRLLQVLLRMVKAVRVLELGTLGGYSAIWMARALPEDGRLITVEKVAERAAVARRYIERAGLADRIDVRVGEAHEVLADIAGGEPFDAVFIDADKRGYPAYLEWCIENVRPGGLVIADNAFKNGEVLEESDDPGVIGIQKFNRRVATDPRFTSIVVPIRDGVAVALIS